MKIIITPLLRMRPNLNEFAIATQFFCLAGLTAGFIIEKLTPIFFFFPKKILF